MSIQDELKAELKHAMRQRDQARLDVIRAVKTEIKVARSAKGFEGEVDDELYRKIIATYVKRMNKARREYEELGERGKEEAKKLAFEVEYLSQWLPQKLGEAETRALIKEALTELGIDDPKQAGRVTGHLMKTHGKDKLDGVLVNRLVHELLTSAKG